mmetsp:Transcript_16959/g.36346  ORF Transcript_16959/g.36346 Transcript_16959/m.36346 type:complete len:249 (-) Transcript_16959:305-1051(-)
MRPRVRVRVRARAGTALLPLSPWRPRRPSRTGSRWRAPSRGTLCRGRAPRCPQAVRPTSTFIGGASTTGRGRTCSVARRRAAATRGAWASTAAAPWAAPISGWTTACATRRATSRRASLTGRTASRTRASAGRRQTAATTAARCPRPRAARRARSGRRRSRGITPRPPSSFQTLGSAGTTFAETQTARTGRGATRSTTPTRGGSCATSAAGARRVTRSTRGTPCRAARRRPKRRARVRMRRAPRSRSA